MSRPKLSTHVLDTARGVPAAALLVELHRRRAPGGEQWVLWHSAATTADGRAHFPFTEDSLPPAEYKLRFGVEDYFRTTGTDTFYPYIEIVFKVSANQHYHVPLLLSPYGYSTYRGS